jgi:glyoxylase-like metal-dependent hydrolase (beta-lactamase superfamily II)
MKKLILVTLLGIFTFAYDLKPVKISPSVYQFVGATEVPSKHNGGNMVNTYWINTGKSYIVIDTGPSYNYAKAAHEAMKKIADLPIKVIINTHMHDDHWSGNNYLKEQGGKIYATKAQATKFPVGVKTHMMSVIKKEDSAGTKVIAIDEYVTKNTSITIDGTTLKFLYLGYVAHTKEDFMVYFKKEKVLFAGDLLFSQRITSIRDGSVEGGLKSLKDIRKLDVKVYAAGHGIYTDHTPVIQMQEYFTALKTKALAAIEEDIGMDEFIKTADFSNFKDKKMMEVLHKPNLGFAYAEYEFFEEE